MSAEGQYLCWGCNLLFGEPDAPVLPSQLCPGCKKLQDRGHFASEYASESPGGSPPNPDDDATGTK
jgi:hypothetical protein